MQQRSRSRIIAVALFLAGIACLSFTATHDDTNRLFFGTWRTRHFLIAVLAFYLGALCLLASASKRALFAAIFATFLMVITLGMVELVGLTGIVSFPRAFGRVRGETWQDRVVPHLDIKGRTYQDLTYDSRIPTEPIEFHYVTDRHGFRNGNDRDEADIYLVGDSILVAGLLPFEDTIAAIVEKDLHVRTMNVAIAGLAVQEERDLFKTAKLPLQNHLVLHFVYEGNDLQDSARYRNRIPMKQLSALERSFSYYFLSWLIDRSDKRPIPGDSRNGTVQGTNYLFAQPNHAFPGNDEEFKHVCQALLDMRDTVTSAGGTFAIVFVPEKIRVLGPNCEFPPSSTIRDYKAHFSPLRGWLTEWCATQGIAMLDLTDALSESTRSGAVPWLPYDTHPNAVGHRVVANAIKNWDAVTKWNASPPTPQPDSSKPKQ